MKKPKKHNFRHLDPEKEIFIEEKKEKTISVSQEIQAYPTIKRDLIRTLITIGSFLALLTILYIIQNKTDVLKPILGFFNL